MGGGPMGPHSNMRVAELVVPISQQRPADAAPQSSGEVSRRQRERRSRTGVSGNQEIQLIHDRRNALVGAVSTKPSSKRGGRSIAPAALSDASRTAAVRVSTTTIWQSPIDVPKRNLPEVSAGQTIGSGAVGTIDQIDVARSAARQVRLDQVIEAHSVFGDATKAGALKVAPTHPS